MEKVISLCNERLSDGTRTFKIEEAEPMETSYGMDLYQEIFGVEGPQRMAGRTARLLHWLTLGQNKTFEPCRCAEQVVQISNLRVEPKTCPTSSSIQSCR